MICAETPMNFTPYQDTAYENLTLFSKPQQLPSNPVQNIILIKSPLQLDQYLTRAVTPTYMFIFGTKNEKNWMEQELIPLVQNTSTNLLLMDARTVPTMACKYNYQGTGPVLIKLYKTHVLRFFKRAFTKPNIIQFLLSTKNWFSFPSYVPNSQS